ncbi:uncharacterized protein LOC130783769 [Actinidia eriantha]|uniref:uncharacterized protein LOC130783769 n=1 Tax=Actinidia eriantha TaxID=165200 RepID=UPI0025865133|nr:uncharacterized protein LOC130783769 [Actinidia eriantha]
MLHNSPECPVTVECKREDLWKFAINWYDFRIQAHQPLPCATLQHRGRAGHVKPGICFFFFYTRQYVTDSKSSCIHSRLGPPREEAVNSAISLLYEVSVSLCFTGQLCPGKMKNRRTRTQGFNVVQPIL